MAVYDKLKMESDEIIVRENKQIFRLIKKNFLDFNVANIHSFLMIHVLFIPFHEHQTATILFSSAILQVFSKMNDYNLKTNLIALQS